MSRPGPRWPAPDVPEPAAPSPPYRQARDMVRLQQLRKTLREIETAAARRSLHLATQQLQAARERLLEIDQQVRHERESSGLALQHRPRDAREIRHWRSRDAALVLSLSEPRLDTSRAEQALAEAQQQLAARAAELRAAALRHEKYTAMRHELAPGQDA